MTPQAAPRAHFGWIEQRTGCSLSPKATAIEVVDARGEIAGMVAYDHWTLNSVQCHVALRFPAAWRALLPAVCRYPLEQAGRGIMLATIAADNARSLRLTERMGFRETHRIRDGWSVGVDLVVMELRKQDCRWLAARKAA